MSTAGSNNSGSRWPFTACQRIFAVASANFSSTRICCVTVSATGGSFGSKAAGAGGAGVSAMPHRQPGEEPIKNGRGHRRRFPVDAAKPGPACAASARAGAARESRSAREERGDTTTKNARAPFGQRSAAHASSVQPRIANDGFAACARRKPTRRARAARRPRVADPCQHGRFVLDVGDFDGQRAARLLHRREEGHVARQLVP